MPINNAQELFVHNLSETYDAEHQFVEGQQEMAQQASDQDLKSAIEEHIGQTEQHARNLEGVFEQLGQQPQRVTNEVAQGFPLRNRTVVDLAATSNFSRRSFAALAASSHTSVYVAHKILEREHDQAVGVASAILVQDWLREAAYP